MNATIVIHKVLIQDQTRDSGSPVDNWILATGDWNDSGVWEDDDVWID